MDYMMKNDLICPIIMIHIKLKNKSNMIQSCFLEIFNYLNKNNVSKVINHIMQ